MDTTPSFQLRNFVALCGENFELQSNRHCRNASEAALRWAAECGFSTQEELKALPSQKLGLLASLCLPGCDYPQLLIVTKWLILTTHHLDTTREAARGILAFEEIWGQLCRETPFNWQEVFKRNHEAFSAARDAVSQDNSEGRTPSHERYQLQRQNSSGIKLLLNLIEYAEGLGIPDDVRYNAAFKQLEQDMMDVILGFIDLASYNIKQASRNNHNLVSVVMEENQITLTSAITIITKMIQESIARFLENEKLLPSFGVPEVNDDVEKYVQGLRNCIIGTAHWIYETDRFFPENAEDVRTFGWVFLLPKQPASVHCS